MVSKQLTFRSPLMRVIVQLLSMVDWWLVLSVGLLLTVGLSTLAHQGSNFFDKQVEFLIAGVIACIAFWIIPYFFWVHKIALPILYGINLALLLAVMVKGHSAMGAQRWLALGPITLQPSEIAKLVVIFTLAAWLGKHPIKSFLDCFKTLGLILVPALLVFKQPDLGTSLTFAAVYLGMVFWAGAGFMDVLALLSPLISLIINALDTNAWLIYLAVLALVLFFFWRRSEGWKKKSRIILIALIVAVNFAGGVARPHLWGLLKEYQQKRLTSFLNPYEDPRGSGYHILQSLIAIGSGGFNGAGLGHGNQSQGAFIPEKHTDFIFAVVGEELGFRIAIFVIIAYGIICFRAIMIAYESRGEPHGSLMAIGIMFMLVFHVFLNIGMTMGIMPVAGVPLPFLSYGGTALIVDLCSIGMLLSIHSLSPASKSK